MGFKFNFIVEQFDKGRWKLRAVFNDLNRAAEFAEKEYMRHASCTNGRFRVVKVEEVVLINFL